MSIRSRRIRLCCALVLVGSLGSHVLRAEEKKGAKPLAGKELQSKVLGAALTQLGSGYCPAQEGEPSVSIRVMAPDAAGQAVSQDVPVGPCLTPMLSELFQSVLLGTRDAAGVKPDEVAPPDSAYWAAPLSTLTKQTFEAVFGQKLLTPTYARDANGQRIALYSPAGLDAAFKALYVKPTESRAGTVVGTLYNAALRDSVRRTAKWTAGALAFGKTFQSASEEFADKVIHDPSFDATTFVNQRAEVLYGPQSTNPKEFDFQRETVVGMLFRRQLDGTLPVLVNALRTTLKDYDPEAFKLYGDKLVPPAPIKVPWPQPRAALKGEALRNSFLNSIAEVVHDECGNNAAGELNIPLPFHAWDGAEKKWTVSSWSATTCTPYDTFALAHWALRGIHDASSFATTYESNSPSAGSVWFSPTDPQVQEAFESVVGVPLVSQTKSAGGREWTFYNPAAVEAVFKAVYLKPSETRFGVVLQKAYDVVLRDHVRAVAETLSKVYAKRPLFEKLAKEYRAQAEADRSFYGPVVADRMAYALNGGRCAGAEDACTGDPLMSGDLLSTLMRRQIDGTLPAVAKALKTVLQDYDKEAMKSYGGKL